MPAVTYRCPKCGWELKRVTSGRPDPSVPCRGKMDCGGTANRVIGSPTVKVVETMDNGLMARPVEQIKDIGEIMKERSKKHGEGPQ